MCEAIAVIVLFVAIYYTYVTMHTEIAVLKKRVRILEREVKRNELDDLEKLKEED